MVIPVSCVICDSSAFREAPNRPYAFCKSCGAAERTRYLWLYLNHEKPLRNGMVVLHCAPEKAVSAKLKATIGPGYRPADFEPNRYETTSVEVEKFDLTDLSGVADGEFDAVMHLHVLEHLYAPLDSIFRETMRVIRPGGRFIFGLPISSGISFENIWPDATPEERLKLFGQHDHVRLVGRDDFPRFLARVLAPFSDQTDFRVDPAKIADADTFFRKTGITVARAAGYTGDTIFDVRKTIAV